MTPYEQHEREVARGWEPYPYAHLLAGAPNFTITGWLIARWDALRGWWWK